MPRIPTALTDPEIHQIVLFASYHVDLARIHMKALILLPVIMWVAYAQVSRTALTGTVTDEQGGRIPLATVKVIDTATGLQRETLTSVQGSYTIADLPVGTFRIEIGKEGFAVFHVDNAR